MINSSKSSFIPKLEIAEPKNTGVWVPFKYASISREGEAPFTISISSLYSDRSSPIRSFAASESKPSITSMFEIFPRCPFV